MVWGTIITLLSNSERSVGSIPTRRVHICIFCSFLWRRGEGKEEGKREGRSSFFCSLWGVDVSLRAERVAGAKKFFFLFFCGAAVAAAFLYWTRHGPPERRRREKKKKSEGKSTGAREETPTSRGRFFWGREKRSL